MCGIVGYVGNKNATPVLIKALKKLEYRGYDSAGIAIYTGEEILVQKAKGKLIGAICAAPGVVLYSHGLIDDKTTASCYPGCECGKNFSKQGVSVSEDGKIITARSAHYAIAFGLEMLKALSGEETSLKVARDLLVIE